MTHFTRNAKRSLQEEMTEHYLGSIAMNKTSGGDGISAELFQIQFGGAPKSLQMVTVAMNLKDAYSLGEKL